jgi:2-dehydro-3-deoxyphosphooctonate aldolase (KDO 8-P synthase)
MKVAGFEASASSPLFLIAGPCVIESEALVLSIAERLKRIAERREMPLVFKASFDKANRSSLGSFRGLGLGRGLEVLARVKCELGLPILTDVHEDTPLDEVADVADVLQTPALLCRQTDFIVRVASQMKPVNLKKGQVLSPAEMANVVAKARSTGNEALLVCERGVCFGYNNLVVDMRSLGILRETGCPVVFDATHSVQQPGALGGYSGGEREHVPLLARAAVAAGVAGLFLETHPDPEHALSDGATMWPLAKMDELLDQLQRIDRIVKLGPVLEDDLEGSPRGREAQSSTAPTSRAKRPQSNTESTSKMERR